MSSLSNLPYGKILDYWYEKLSGKPYRYKFLLTKAFEVFIFKSKSGRDNSKSNYLDFPLSKINKVPIKPKLSIVIPTFLKTDKDKQDIFNLLKSIEVQTLCPNEIIIVDDCSPLSITFPEAIKVIRLQQNSGPAKARNIGKKLALENGADIIAFTDTDCVLAKHWVKTISESFSLHRENHILSGDTPAIDSSWFGMYHNINGTLNGRRFKNTDRLLYGTTANLSITREVAENIDFSENFPIAAGEDIDFCFKANLQGFAITYIPTMTVYHHYGYNQSFISNLKRFIHQFHKYGTGEKILLKEIPNYYVFFDKTEEIPTM